MDDFVAMVAELCSFADTARLRRVSTRCLWLLDDWPFQQMIDGWWSLGKYLGRMGQVQKCKDAQSWNIMKEGTSIPSRRRMSWALPSKVPEDNICAEMKFPCGRKLNRCMCDVVCVLLMVRFFCLKRRKCVWSKCAMDLSVKRTRGSISGIWTKIFMKKPEMLLGDFPLELFWWDCNIVSWIPGRRG